MLTTATGIMLQVVSPNGVLCAPAAKAKTAPAPTASWEPSAVFVNHMKAVEGCVVVNGFLVPYDSAEGGAQTDGYGHKKNYRGYGHKATAQENTGAMTEAQATAQLISDIKIHEAKGCRQWGYSPKMEVVKWIVTEYTFNGCGPTKFPKFFAALKLCDQGKADLKTLGTVLKEYERKYTDAKGVVHKMVKRNRQTSDLFFTLENFAAFSGQTPTGLLASGFDISVLTKKNQLAAKSLLVQLEKMAKVKAPTPQQATSAKLTAQANRAVANNNAKVAVQKAYHDKYLKDKGNNGVAMR